MNVNACAISVITVLLYDCIFVNIEFFAAYSSIFPIFPPVFSQNIHRISPCKLPGTCRNNINAPLNLPVCYCDISCRKYNDCCSDANTTSITVSDRRQYPSYDYCQNKLFLNRWFGVLMIAKCPSTFNDADISEKCSLSQNIHPVFARDGKNYRNVYCAYCHNVHQYTPWQFQFQLGEGNCTAEKMNQFNSTIPSKIRHLMDNNCKYLFLPPFFARYRTCFKDDNEMETALSPRCLQFQNPLVIDNTLYRNFFCYNGSYAIGQSFCLEKSRISQLYNGNKRYSNLNLVGMFNVYPVLEILGQKFCDEKFYYDRKKDICISKKCSESEVSTCEAELIRNSNWSKELKFVSNNAINIDFILRLSMFVYISFPVRRYEISLDFVSLNYTCGINITFTKNVCCIGSCKVFFINNGTMTQDAIDSLKSDALEMTWVYQEGTSNTVTTVYDLDLYKTTNLEATCKAIRSPVTMKKITGINPHTFLTPNMNKIKINPNEVPEHVRGYTAIMEGPPGSQTLYRLEKWEPQYGFNDQINKTNATITDSEIHDDYWSVGTIMTYITMGISCITLTLTIVVYSKIGMFQSQPGVISKHMMVNMLAAQLLFIGGVGADYIKVVCTIIGIISHFLWLCSFTWISVFLLNVWKVFRILESCPGALLNVYKLSKVYYCFGYLLPFVIVLTCSVLDIFTEVNIGYSSDNICFPTGILANLFSFTLPVVLSLFTNVVVLVGTSFAMSRYNNAVHRLKTMRQVRSFIPIYIRLCIFSSFPWILGIIADILKSNSLRYVFILLAGSQGTFVGISFLLSQSVRKWAVFHRSSTNRKTNTIEMGQM